MVPPVTTLLPPQLPVKTTLSSTQSLPDTTLVSSKPNTPVPSQIPLKLKLPFKTAALLRQSLPSQVSPIRSPPTTTLDVPTKVPQKKKSRKVKKVATPASSPEDTDPQLVPKIFQGLQNGGCALYASVFL